MTTQIFQDGVNGDFGSVETTFVRLNHNLMLLHGVQQMSTGIAQLSRRSTKLFARNPQFSDRGSKLADIFGILQRAVVESPQRLPEFVKACEIMMSLSAQ